MSTKFFCESCKSETIKVVVCGNCGEEIKAKFPEELRELYLIHADVCNGEEKARERRRIATKIIENFIHDANKNPEELAKWAVNVADSLTKELDKPLTREEPDIQIEPKKDNLFKGTFFIKTKEKNGISYGYFWEVKLYWVGAIQKTLPKLIYYRFGTNRFRVCAETEVQKAIDLANKKYGINNFYWKEERT